MYLRSLLIISAVSSFEDFEPLSDHLPSDIAFNCGGKARIVGGVEAKDAWPFLVQIRSWTNKTRISTSFGPFFAL